MSRIRPRHARPSSDDQLLLRISAVWPAACILSLSTGCYFGPIELVPRETAPQIYSSNVTFGEPIRIEKDKTRVVVYATDDDESTLFATWDLSTDGVIRNAETSYDPTFWTQVELDRDDDLDGQVLTVMVRDGQFQDSQSWLLEVVR